MPNTAEEKEKQSSAGLKSRGANWFRKRRGGERLKKKGFASRGKNVEMKRMSVRGGKEGREPPTRRFPEKEKRVCFE